MYKIGDQMNIKISPNRWSCVPCAFATVIDVELETLLDLIKHDGSEIIHQDLEEPLCRRGFTCQELAIVLWNLGYFVGSFDWEPFAMTDKEHYYTVYYEETEKIFDSIMQNSLGVILGRIRDTENTHAAAWNGIQCFDPTGFIYPVSKYEIYSYHPVIQL